MIFPRCFPVDQITKRPKVTWSDAEACRPSDTFPEGEVYGIVTGADNAILGLDLDVKNGKNGIARLQEYMSEHGIDLPETRAVRTKSGGLHLYFQWDPQRPVSNRAGVLPGVDVRGHMGVLYFGGAYKVILDAPIAAAPEWLIELVGTRDATPALAEVAHAIGPDHPEWDYRLSLARAFIAGEPPCIEGEGKSEAQVWKMCLRLSRTCELPPETSLELLQPYLSRCAPPGYVEGKFRHGLVRAAQHGQGPTGTFSAAFMSGLRTDVEAPPRFGLLDRRRFGRIRRIQSIRRGK